MRGWEWGRWKRSPVPKCVRAGGNPQDRGRVSTLDLIIPGIRCLSDLLGLSTTLNPPRPDEGLRQKWRLAAGVPFSDL